MSSIQSIGKKIAERYCLIDQIGKGGMGVVYRAMPFDDPSNYVAIKIVKRSNTLNYEDILAFQREASLMSRLYHQNIITFHELGLLDENNYEGGYYIVMELVTGNNLKKSIVRDGRKDLSFFFELGLQLADALDYTHGKNIIHRDIKPQNIIVTRSWQDGQALLFKVLDFGVARLAEATNMTGGDAKQAGDIAGTPLYMAPEQTKLLNEPIDHRVDLYSLGCVLYETLTGNPPFRAKNREGLERLHVSEIPPSICALRSDVPPIVEKIIMKLLEKRPGDRYQTAFALRADLMRAKAIWQKDPQAEFVLAQKDHIEAIAARIPMVGRDSHMKTLIDEYKAVSDPRGRSRICVVKGEGAVGKSRLLTEFRSYLTQNKIRYISSKFSRHENALPFNALANAFNEYLAKILKTQPREVEAIKQKVNDNVGPMAYQIAEIVPGLKPYLKDLKDFEASAPHEDFAIFAKAFSDFTKCLATDDHPVVFIFHDLHWADDKSLELIDTFFSYNNSQRFYLVFSYNSSEGHFSPLFEKFLDKFKKLRRRFCEVNLNRLSEVEVTKMSQYFLRTEDSLNPDLTTYLTRESGGAPNYLVELLKNLVAQDLLVYDSGRQAWVYEMEALEKASFKVNFVDLILAEVKSLRGIEKDFLEIASVIGMAFQFELVSLGDRTKALDLINFINKLSGRGLISHSRGMSNLKSLGKTYTFTHKQVRTVIYDSIAPERLAAMHLKVGEHVAKVIKERDARTVFNITHHFNSALKDPSQKTNKMLAERAVEFNLLAAEHATAAQAWQSAQRYLENAFELMEKWGGAFSTEEQRSELSEAIADIYAVQKKYGAAIQKYKDVLAGSYSKNVFTRVSNKLIHLQVTSGLISNAKEVLENILGKMGVNSTPTSMDLIKHQFYLEKDAYMMFSKNANIQRALRIAYRESKQPRKMEHPQARLLQTGSALYALEEPDRALVLHNAAFHMALTNPGTPEDILRILTDRAVWFAKFGHLATSEKLFSYVRKMAQSLRLRSLYGSITLTRALLLEFIKRDHEHVYEHVRSATKYLSTATDRLACANMMLFKIFNDLTRCDFKALHTHSVHFPNIVPTRNHMSPRYVAMLLFGDLLQGRRDLLVRRASIFLNRRDQVNARRNDIFVEMISTMVAFSRGEENKSREMFLRIMKRAHETKVCHTLLGFELDFLNLFVAVFLDLYKTEHAKDLMKGEELANMWKFFLSRRASGNMLSIELRSLLKAKLAEVSKKSNTADLYNETLRTSNNSSNNLVKALARFWFGRYLYTTRRHTKRLEGTVDLMQRLELYALCSAASSLLGREELQAKTEVEDSAQIMGARLSNSIVEHMNFICHAAQRDTGVEDDFAGSMRHIDKMYKPLSIHFYSFANPSHKMLYGFGNDKIHIENDDEIIDYLSSYLNIRSALFLPVNDTPWSLEAGISQELSETEAHQSTTFSEVSFAEDNNATAVIKRESSKTALKPVEDAPGNTSVLRIRFRMNALVPVKASGRNLGLLFIQGLDMQNSNSSKWRDELDQLGSQLGLICERKGTNLPLDLRASNYSPGEFNLEPVDWLNVWQGGAIRKKRESTWFLGLNFGENFYLLVYLNLEGEEANREQISSILWHQCHVFRAFFLSTGEGELGLEDVRKNLGGWLVHLAKQFPCSHIAFAYTLFDRRQSMAFSGHFGPTRPMVIGQDNQVRPYDAIMAQLSNGSDLRYWEVVAGIADVHLYILAFDSGMVDPMLSDNQRRAISSSLALASSVADYQRLLKSVLEGVPLPRYYVAVYNFGDDYERHIDSRLAIAE